MTCRSRRRRRLQDHIAVGQSRGNGELHLEVGHPVAVAVTLKQVDGADKSKAQLPRQVGKGCTADVGESIVPRGTRIGVDCRQVDPVKFGFEDENDISRIGCQPAFSMGEKDEGVGALATGDAIAPSAPDDRIVTVAAAEDVPPMPP